MQNALAALEGEPVEVFVVWLPAIRSDHYDATEESRKILHDERARHYWDGSQALGEALARAIGMNGSLAWDVYLVFDPDARWGDAPPKPAAWLHQKPGEDPALVLTEEKLIEQMRNALK